VGKDEKMNILEYVQSTTWTLQSRVWARGESNVTYPTRNVGVGNRYHSAVGLLLRSCRNQEQFDTPFLWMASMMSVLGGCLSTYSTVLSLSSVLTLFTFDRCGGEGAPPRRVGHTYCTSSKFVNREELIDFFMTPWSKEKQIIGFGLRKLKDQCAKRFYIAWTFMVHSC
jgi:hypothetical protein